MTIKRNSVCALVCIICFCALAVLADNWPQFRGTGSRGVSSEKNLPVKWSATENVKWKTKLPGPGHSSPVIWGDRIFLTAYRKAEKGELLVLCLDKKTGRILWERKAPATGIEKVHATNSPASPTPVTDGKYVYVWFGSYGLLCFDFAGNKIWEQPIGPHPIEWGSGSSPILYKDMVLLNCETDAEDFLLAVDKNTGKTIWRTAQPNTERAWPTPVVWNVAGRDQVVISGSGGVKAYDPQDGKEIWMVEGLPRWVTQTPVVANDLLFVASFGLDQYNFIMAIRPGGRGNITQNNVAWRQVRNLNSISSPVIVGDQLFVVRNGGIMACLDAKTGNLIWQERLPAPGDYYASLVAGDGKIYALSEEGIATVIAAKPVYELLGRNVLGERCLASPAISERQVFIRSDESLFCIGAK
jgi:outer membrane protein assembly factor BamB